MMFTCPMCNKQVPKEQYLPGLNKCFNCCRLIKRLHQEGKMCQCVVLIYSNNWENRYEWLKERMR